MKDVLILLLVLMTFNAFSQEEDKLAIIIKSATVSSGSAYMEIVLSFENLSKDTLIIAKPDTDLFDDWCHPLSKPIVEQSDYFYKLKINSQLAPRPFEGDEIRNRKFRGTIPPKSKHLSFISIMKIPPNKSIEKTIYFNHKCTPIGQNTKNEIQIEYLPAFKNISEIQEKKLKTLQEELETLAMKYNDFIESEEISEAKLLISDIPISLYTPKVVIDGSNVLKMLSKTKTVSNLIEVEIK